MIDQGEFFQIPSPCQGICQMNSKGYCIGCFRNRDERLYWNNFSEFQKQLVINLCNKRKIKVIQVKQQSQQSVVLEDNAAKAQFDLFHEVKIDRPTEPREQLTPAPKDPKARDEEQLDLF